MKTPKNPMQPFVMEKNVVRFKRNKLVEYLLDKGGLNLNDLAAMEDEFSQDDWQQFAQLIGYSLCGYHELSYVSDKNAKAASKAAQKLFPECGGCRDTRCEIHCGVEEEE